MVIRNKIHRGTHRQKPLLAAARESGHIPPSFSNKAINAVPPPVWPRSQQYNSRCSVPIGHGLSNTIPAVPSPLATVSATPYPLFRPHWPRSQLRHTCCLFRPHWPRSQLRHTRCFVPIGHDLSFTIPAVSVPFGHRTSFTIPAVSVPFGHRTSFTTHSHRCRPVGPIHTSQTPIPRRLHQARYIDISC